MALTPEQESILDAWVADRGWVTPAPCAPPPSASLADTIGLAEALGVSRIESEIALLEHGISPARYLRNLGVIGIDGQVALLRACVAIVGAGGLGGWVAESLSRMGVGCLRLIDGDTYQDSNLNRQLGCTETTLGQAKASCLARRLIDVNGGTKLETIDTALTAENASQLLCGADVVVDALDSIHSRLLLQRATQALHLPLVHGAIAGWTGQVMTVLPGDVGLEAIYGAAPTADRGIEARTGTPSPTPMMVAAWMAQECVKLITGRETLIRRRMLLLDALFGVVEELRLD